MPAIKLEKVTKYYRPEKRWWRRNQKIEIGVKDVDLVIEQGDFVFVIGSSGAGKSTLLDLISGRMRPDRGTVYFDGKGLSRLVASSHNQSGILFGKVSQEPTLVRKMTVEENLRLAAQIGRRKLETAKEMNLRVRKVLGLVGMWGAEKKYPVEMSIGECRRVELARALINSPPVLVLDEITANLDEDSMWDILMLLMEINRRGTTVIMATHASKYVNILRRRVVTLVHGRVFGDVKKGRYGDVV